MFKEIFAEINNIYVKINNKFEDSKFLNTSLKIINWLIWSFFLREYLFVESTSQAKTRKKQKLISFLLSSL